MLNPRRRAVLLVFDVALLMEAKDRCTRSGAASYRISEVQDLAKAADEAACFLAEDYDDLFLPRLCTRILDGFAKDMSRLLTCMSSRGNCEA
jgi:hypothetical protein